MKSERMLQSQGFGSRRECRARIRSGALRISGVVIDDPFVELDTTALEFTLDGVDWRYREHAYLMLHKPAGYECTRKPQHHPSIFALLPAELAQREVQSVGRLDQDTTGLLLLSDDGQFIHVWSSGKKRIPKVYQVTTSSPVTEQTVSALLAGVQLHDEPAPIRATACHQSGEYALEITVTEGKYHQVKRMLGAIGNRVETLHRSAVGGLTLPADLQGGLWRWLGDSDLERLQQFAAVED